MDAFDPHNTPMTEELIAHTRALVEASGGAAELSQISGVCQATVNRIRRGQLPSNVRTTTLEAMFDVRVEQVEWRPDPVIVECLERARRNGPPYPTVAFPFKQKDRYAAHMFDHHGWTRSEIFSVFHMSWKRVTEAVGKCP